MTGAHRHEPERGWLSPTRREQLRNGAKPFTALERAFQVRHREHQKERRAADDRRP